MSDPVDVSAIMNSEEAPQVESAPAVEETAPAAPVEEPAPVEETAPVEAPSTQEVVQNVQEMLSSTDTSGSANNLENRVKVLEDRLDNLITLLRSGYKEIWYDEREKGWVMEMLSLREQMNNV